MRQVALVLAVSFLARLFISLASYLRGEVRFQYYKWRLLQRSQARCREQLERMASVRRFMVLRDIGEGMVPPIPPEPMCGGGWTSERGMPVAS